MFIDELKEYVFSNLMVLLGTLFFIFPVFYVKCRDFDNCS